MILQDATAAEIDAILAATHSLWGDGLDLRAYREYVATLMSSAWGGGGMRGFRFLAFRAAPGGPILASMKLYRFAARLGDRTIQIGGVGAVFTMPEARRQGHAAAMLEQAHELMRQRGDALALLFSEIGADYYAGLGYERLPSRAVKLPVTPGARPPEGITRMRKSEMPVVAQLRARADRDQPCALERDESYWQYLLARHSMPTLWLGPDQRESLLLMQGRLGYLWALFFPGQAGPRARLLEEAEETPGAALPGLRQALHAECGRRGVTGIEASGSAGQPDPDAPAPMWRVLDESIRQRASALAPSISFHLTDVF